MDRKGRDNAWCIELGRKVSGYHAMRRIREESVGMTRNASIKGAKCRVDK